MNKEFKGLIININNVKHSKKCNILTINEERFNDSQYNALSKQHKKLGFLECNFKYKNDNVDIYYDTTDLISLNEYFEMNSIITENEFVDILRTICQLIKSSSNYIYFNEGNFLIDGDLIYIDQSDKSIYITYIPIRGNVTNNIILDVKFLIRECINRRINIEEKSSNFTQELLEILRDNYLDIDKLIKFLSYRNDIEVKVDNPKHKKRIQPEPISIESSHVEPIINQQQKKLSEEKSKNKGFFARLFGGNKSKSKSMNNSVSFCNKKMEVYSFEEEDNYDTVILGVEEQLKTGYLIENNSQSKEDIKINKTEFIIGRLKETVDYYIENRAVGKIHAKFIIKDDKFYLIDLDSKNGTFIDGTKLQSKSMYEVRDGSKITFANSSYIFRSSN